MNFYEKVYSVVETIPCGKVVTYGTVAKLVGSPRASRMVGNALHKNPKPGVIPCHRVVFKDGSLAKSFAFGGEDMQLKLLQNEGIIFKDGKVDMTLKIQLVEVHF